MAVRAARAKDTPPKVEPPDKKWGSSSSQWGDCNWSWNSDSTWNNWNSDWKSGSKRKRPTIAESTGMELHGRHPKTATREFLQRYAGRDLTLDDCNYETEQGEEGFRTKLYVPVWSDQIFQGQWCDSLKEAEVSAARCFVEDPEVVATASTLPAPISIIKHWTKVYKKKGRGPVSGAEINHESRRQYNDQRNHGCRMAVWDGNF